MKPAHVIFCEKCGCLIIAHSFGKLSKCPVCIALKEAKIIGEVPDAKGDLIHRSIRAQGFRAAPEGIIIEVIK
jgi:phage FluMu protein Com